MPNWLELDGVANARIVVPGVLIRSDNLQDLTPRDVRHLVDEQDVRHVIDLRTEPEVHREGPGPLASEPAVEIQHRSLYPEVGELTDVDAQAARPWGVAASPEDEVEHPVVRAYLGYITRRPDSVLAAVRTIAKGPGATIVHCAAGKDRTGTVVAMTLDACGVPHSEIVADYQLTATRIEGIIDRLLSTPTYRDEVKDRPLADHTPPVGTMDRLLELLAARHGGSAGWLLEHGLTEAELAQLRASVRPQPGREPRISPG